MKDISRYRFAVMWVVVGMVLACDSDSSCSRSDIKARARNSDPLSDQSPKPPINSTITRHDAMADARELLDLLESAHPDPYVRGGGKVAFHRRFQRLLREIPDDGISREQFVSLLKKFIAGIGDGHTAIDTDAQSLDRHNPGGIPLYFQVVDDQLYVQAVTMKKYRPYIGYVLESVQAISFSDLVQRQRRLGGFENHHQLLASLSAYGSLYYGAKLAELVPEWHLGDKITVELRDLKGEHTTVAFQPIQNVTYPLLENQTALGERPPPNKWFYYHFLEKTHRVAYLAITSMSTYREAFEYWRAKGDKSLNNLAYRVYEIVNDKEPPSDYDEVIRGIPSASETFLSLFAEMKKEDTQTLIVDLTDNGGGLDLMNPMFLYYLVGFDRAVSLSMKNSEVRKCSAFLESQSESGLGLEDISLNARIPLKQTDYDFSKDPVFDPSQLDRSVRDYLTRAFGTMPTFIDEFKSRRNEAVYKPPRIIALSSATTFSAGFNLLTDLHRLGAIIVGVPSGQAGNSFGDVRRFALSKSKIEGTVSTKYFEAFPDDPQKGRVLPVDIPISYSDLLGYGFDKHAILRFAMRHCSTQQ